jgi:hypothetical protein
MTEATPRPTPLRSHQFPFTTLARATALVAALSFLAGGLTTWAQTVLPYSLFFLANSASGWILVMVPLLWCVRHQPLVAAILGSVSGILLMLGFTAAWAVLHEQPYDPWLWTLSGAVAGLFIGLATAWLPGHGIRAALGTAALAGVAIGDAWYGLTAVRATTSPVYWTLIGLVGLAFLAVMLTRRLRGELPIVLAIAGTVFVATVFLPVYGAVGSVA